MRAGEHHRPTQARRPGDANAGGRPQRELGLHGDRDHAWNIWPGARLRTREISIRTGTTDIRRTGSDRKLPEGPKRWTETRSRRTRLTTRLFWD